jgi:hypothetical protein
VRRGDDLWKLRETPIDRRLGFEDVEAGAAHVPGLNRVGERPFVDERAARRVDDADARLAFRQAFGVEQPLRSGRGRDVQREVVRPRAHIVK